MRVGFNARTLSAPQLRGWSRYTSNLCRELTHLGVHVYLLSDREINEEWLKDFNREKLKVIVKKGKFYFHWEQVVLPQLCRAHRLDVLHCPINYGLPVVASCPQVLTLHDAIEKAFYDQDKSWGEKLSPLHVYIRGLHYLSQFASHRIITVSQHAKQDLNKYYGVNPDKVDVIYEAADPLFDQGLLLSEADMLERWRIKAPYFFYVGGLEKRKNIPFLIQAFSQLRTKESQLVLAGGGQDIDSHRRLAEKLDVVDRVHFLGWVDEKDLPSLYRRSVAFIYPSLYEGFGLQIVEAMNLGIPVLTSNRTSLPEILGNHEATFNPEQVGELRTLMNHILEDVGFAESLRQHSLKRSKDFSWLKTAQETKKVYQSLVTR